MSKSISMKRLYQWLDEYPEWKRLPENNHGTSEEAILHGVTWVYDFLAMVWEKRKENGK